MTQKAVSSLARGMAKQVYIGCYRALQCAGITPRPRWLLVFAHARSGSSLLTHILASNPRILAWGEVRWTYRTCADFLASELYSRKMAGKLFRPFDYITDKINQNALTPDLELFDSTDIDIILLTRDPARAASSLLAMSDSYKAGVDKAWVMDYFLQRYPYLARFGTEHQHSRRIWISYESLLNDTDAVLNTLAQFLSLSSPLSERYPTHQFTGMRGDPSPKIWTGRIEASQRPLRSDLTTDELKDLASAGKACEDQLRHLSYQHYSSEP